MAFSAKTRPVRPAVPAPSPVARRTKASWSWKIGILAVAVAALAVAARYAPSWVGKLPLTGSAAKTGQQWAAAAARYAVPVLWVCGVLFVLTVITGTLLSRRRSQSDRVAAAITGVTRDVGAPDGVVRVQRGPLGRARRVRVQVPPDFNVEDPKERRKIEQATARILGGSWVGDWNPVKLRKGRLILTRGTPDVTDSEEDKSDKGRVLTVVRKVFGKTAGVESEQFDDNGRMREFVITFPATPQPSIPVFREKFETAIGGLLPGLWEATWDLAADRVAFSHRPELARSIPYTPEPVTDANRFVLAVARAAGQLVSAGWNLEGKTPHALITGATGSGKTYAFLNLALECLRRGIPVIGIDPKMVELMALENWPGLEMLATGDDPESMVKAIDYLEALMMYRYRLIRARKVRRSDLWPVVAFLDELLILRDLLNDHWAEEKVRKGLKGGSREHPALRKIVRIAVLARTARVHQAVGVQRGQATLFEDGARDNFRFRLSVGAQSEEGARQMWGDTSIGRDIPDDIPGRGIVVTGKGPTECQVYKLPELDLTIPDSELPPEDAQLRRQLLDECRRAVTELRPAEPILDIAGHVLSTRPAELDMTKDEGDGVDDDQAATEPVMMPVKGLSEGDRVLVDDPDDEGEQVQAVVETIDTETDEDRIVIDFRTDSGTAGQLDLDPDDELPLAG